MTFTLDAGETPGLERDAAFKERVTGVFLRSGVLILCILAMAAAAGCVSPPEEVTEVPDFAAVLPVNNSSDPEPAELLHNLTVRSDPPFSLIYLNGEYTGHVTPYMFENLPTGRYTVSVSDGWNHSKENTFDLTRSGKVSFDIPSGMQKYGRILGDGEISSTGAVLVYASPGPVVITINTKKLYQEAVDTPYVVGGIKGDTWAAVRVSATKSEFAYDRGSYPVFSRAVSYARFTVGTEAMREYTILSDAFAGCRYSIDGDLSLGTIPETRSWPDTQQFFVVKNGSEYVSFFSGDVKRTGTAIQVEPREYTTYAVRVTSPVPGARIFVDGMDTGYHTPYTIPGLSDGFHKITVSRLGYYPVEKDIQLSGESFVLDVAMPQMTEYSSGYLQVTSAKPGAKVYIHGKDTGERTPVVFPHMPIGKYSIRVSPSSEDTQEITVLPRQVTRAEFS